MAQEHEIRQRQRELIIHEVKTNIKHWRMSHGELVLTEPAGKVYCHARQCYFVMNYKTASKLYQYHWTGYTFHDHPECLPNDAKFEEEAKKELCLK